MTPQEFVEKWKKVKLTERSAAQQHFLDLCELLGHEKPAAADPEGESFTFEKGAAKHGGGDGWADVWKKDFFAWEYKGKHKDLAAAYDQLLRYYQALNNPPLLVVCDMDRFEIHTNFNNKPKVRYDIRPDNFCEPEQQRILKALFFEPKKLEPGETNEKITEEVAERFEKIADSLRKRKFAAEEVSHFLMKLMSIMRTRSWMKPSSRPTAGVPP